MKCFVPKRILHTLILMFAVFAVFRATPIHGQDADGIHYRDSESTLTVASEIVVSGNRQPVDEYLISGNGELIPGAKQYADGTRVRLSAERPSAIAAADCSLQWWWYEPTYDDDWHSVPQSNQNPQPVIDRDKWFTARWTCSSLPTPPSVPILDAISNPEADGNYAVNWSTVAGADSYQLQENKDGGSGLTVYSGANRAYTVTGQSEGGYCYRVRATNASGSSVWSSTQCTTVEPAPEPPSTPTLDAISNPASNGDFIVNWSSVATASSYQLQENRNGSTWLPVYSGADRSYNAEVLDDGDYCYRVRAINSGGEGAWSSTSCTTVDMTSEAPATPALDMIANSDANGDYTVSWSESQDAITYQLQERKNSGAWTTVYSGRQQSFDAVNYSAGDYCYRVLARNALGYSDWSSARCTTVAPPPTPDCYVLTRSHNGNGTDPVASPAQSDGCPAETYLAGEMISLSANPADSWHVFSWIGTSDDESKSQQNSVVMPEEDHTVSVIFEQTLSPVFLPMVY